MAVFEVKENLNRYFVVAYCDNPVLINHLSEVFKSENIDVIIGQNLVKNNTFHENMMLSTIVFPEYLHLLKKPSKFFTKAQIIVVAETNEATTLVKKNESANLVIVNSANLTPKQICIKVRDSTLQKNSTDFKSKRVVANNHLPPRGLRRKGSKRNKSTRLYTQRNALFIVGFLTLVFMILPFALTILTYANIRMLEKTDFFNYQYFSVQKILGYSRRFQFLTKKVFSFYSKTPFISGVYNAPAEFVDKTYEKTDVLNMTISLVNFEKEFVFSELADGSGFPEALPSKIPEKTIIEISKLKSFRQLVIDEGYLRKFWEYYQLLNNPTAKSQKHYVFVVKDAESPTITGGKIEKIYLLKADERGYQVEGLLLRDELRQKFKGKVLDIKLMEGEEYIFDGAYSQKDQFKMLQKAVAEIYQVPISGQISISKSAFDSVSAKGKPKSVKESLEFLKEIVNLVSSKDINLYLGEGESFPEKVGNCQPSSISLINVSKNAERLNVVFDGTELREGMGFTISFGQHSRVQDVVIIIPEKEFLEFNLISKRNAERLLYDGRYYYFLKLFPSDVNESFAKVTLKNICDKRGLSILKEAAAENIWFKINLGLMQESFIFENGVLTGRGDKLYNSESVEMSRDFVFSFLEAD